MTEEQRQEREDWEALIGSEGWRRFVAYAEQKWTGAEAFRQRVINGPDAADAVIAACAAMSSVIGYPVERLRALSRPDSMDPFKDHRRVP